MTTDLTKIWTKSALVQAVKAVSHFFDEGAMRFFNSRLESSPSHSYAGLLFITSEQFDHNSPRLYTVRLWDGKGMSVETLSKFQEFSTLEDAEEFISDYQKKETPA